MPICLLPHQKIIQPWISSFCDLNWIHGQLVLFKGTLNTGGDLKASNTYKEAEYLKPVCINYNSSSVSSSAYYFAGWLNKNSHQSSSLSPLIPCIEPSSSFTILEKSRIEVFLSIFSYCPKSTFFLEMNFDSQIKFSFESSHLVSLDLEELRS